MENENISEENISEVSIENQVSDAFLEYAVSVIVSRALPDVRDGLKPVHRRIAYVMEESSYHNNKAYKKSARIIGEVMGKYHPHGDTAIYEAMVRMAQPWAMRVPLVDGQGNYGSVDGDPPAAMRYTEARMSKATHLLVEDIDKNTVDFRENYDNTLKEPVVLPTRIPNLLLNGGSGIAVGMATNIAPHNMVELLELCLSSIDNPDMSVEEIMNIMPGPDFPTGGVIMGRSGIKEAYETGRGSIQVSGVFHVEENGKRNNLILTELPYAVNKERMVERIRELVRDGVIEGVNSVQDLSNRKGMKVVVGVKRDFEPHVVISKIKKHTAFVSNFSYNATCLDPKGRPGVMSVREMVNHFIDFRKVVVRRRTLFELEKARTKLNLVIGLYLAVLNLDKVVNLIRSSSNQETARQRLKDENFQVDETFRKLILESDPDSIVGEVFTLSDLQVRAVLDMRLHKLTGLEREKIVIEAENLSIEIARCLNIVNNIDVLVEIVRNELLEIKSAWPMERMTVIKEGEFGDVEDGDLIERQEVILTLTHSGYVKYTPLDMYRNQNRGGKGKSGMDTKEDDVVNTSLTLSTHTPLLIVTTRGIAHIVKTYKLPEGGVNTRGRPIVNFIPLVDEEKIATIMPLPENVDDLEGKSMIFVTDFGNVRRSDALDFAKVNSNGKIAMNLEKGGNIVNVLLSDADDDIMLITKNGMATRFNIGSQLRIIGSRASTGVRGMKLKKNDKVISATIVKPLDATIEERSAWLNGGSITSKDADGIETTTTLDEEQKALMLASEEFVLTVTDQGYGKKSSTIGYRVASRAGLGIGCCKTTKATGGVVYAGPIKSEDDLIMITDTGKVIRIASSQVNSQGRATKGTKLFSIDKGQKIVDVSVVSNKEITEEESAEEDVI